MARWLGSWLVFATLMGLAAFTYTFMLASDLFVWTEARNLILGSWSLDPFQWLLAPVPNYGPGRLTGMASFQVTGALCRADAVCVNGVGAAMVGLAVGAIAIHTRQVASSRLVAIVVGTLWLLSAPVLGITIWQSARFDILAFIGVMAAGILWWSAFGRRHVSKPLAVAVALGSPFILAFAFNAKEVTYYLPASMILLAVTRGLGRAGAVRRNLLLSLVPLAYSVWFLAVAFMNISPSYAVHADSGGMFDRIPTLVQEGLGLFGNFMFVWQSGPLLDQLNAAARGGYAVLGGLLAVGLALIAWRAIRAGRSIDRTRPRSWWLRRAGPWLYLGLTMIAIVVIGSRSRGIAAYYMPIALWAFLTLVLMAIGRVAAAVPGRRLAIGVTAVLVGVFVTVNLLSYVSHLAPGSTYQALASASDRLWEVRGILDRTLGDRPVERVSWWMEDLGPTAYFVTQGDPETLLPDDDIWPWLRADADARADVTGRLDGSAADHAADVASHSSAGDLVIVMDAAYEPELVAYAGDVVFERLRPPP